MSQQINLYEERLRPRLELATARNVAAAALATLLLVAAMASWTAIDAKRKVATAAQSLQALQAAQEQLKAAAQKASERKVSPGLQNELSAAKAKLQAGQDVIGALEHGRLAESGQFSDFMQGFAKQAGSAGNIGVGVGIGAPRAISERAYSSRFEVSVPGAVTCTGS